LPAQHIAKQAKEERQMNYLNCKAGDLAIFINDDGKMQNLGIIVRIISPYGFNHWYTYSERLKRFYKRSRRLYSWNVEALSATGITYCNEDGALRQARFGIAPDSYLKPLPKLRKERTRRTQQNLPQELICQHQKEKS